MTLQPDRYHATIQLIQTARLTPTEHLIWRAFLNEAVDSEHAARYLWDKVHADSGSTEQALGKLKVHWKQIVLRLTKRDPVPFEVQKLVKDRDGSHCFMTRRKPTNFFDQFKFEHAWVIPPSFLDGGDMDAQGSLYPMLEAFLTPARMFELKSLLQTDTPAFQLRNQLLLSSSIHIAFRRGNIQLCPNYSARWNDEAEAEAEVDSKNEVSYFVLRQTPEPCRGLTLSNGVPWNSHHLQSFTMETKDDNLPLPKPFLLRVHHGIAESLHLFRVEEIIAQGWPSSSLFHLNTVVQKSLRSIWRLLPKKIRVLAYHFCLNLSGRLYPPCSTGLVHQLPFGLYVKECNYSSRNEIEALRLLEKYTSIPAPLWIDDYQGQHPMLIMTACPGKRLSTVYHRLSYSQRRQLVTDLKSVLSKLRQIPNKTGYLFSNSHGGPMMDWRFPLGVAGPFRLIQEFNSFLVHRYVQKETKEKIAHVHTRDYRSVFTHADLHAGNILIENGRLSGILNWKLAGFYPEYWEFTKLMYGGTHALRRHARELFEGYAYEEELEAERLLWDETYPWT